MRTSGVVGALYWLARGIPVRLRCFFTDQVEVLSPGRVCMGVIHRK